MMSKKKTISEDRALTVQSQILLYQTENGQTRIEVRLENETVWLTQKLMADLFQKDVLTINEHIQNIYEVGELSPDSTIRKFRIVQTEGTRQVSREMDFYNQGIRDVLMPCLIEWMSRQLVKNIYMFNSTGP